MKQITIALSIATLLATSMVSAQICTNNVYEKIDNNRYEILGANPKPILEVSAKYRWTAVTTVVGDLGNAAD